jgi:hypothetical protein
MLTLGDYVRASTANPTGWRPWNSRLSFYIPNSFPLPTTGRGPFLFQPGVCGRPAYNGGLGRFRMGDDSTDVLGDSTLSIDPTLLGLGLVALAAVFFLSRRGGGKSRRRQPTRRVRKARRKLTEAQAQLALAQARG